VLCDQWRHHAEDVFSHRQRVEGKLPDARLAFTPITTPNRRWQCRCGDPRWRPPVQGTLNGLGERCGKCQSLLLLPNLMLKEPFASQFEPGVQGRLKQLTHVSRLLDEILNRSPNRYAAYVGASAHPQGRVACLGRGQEPRNL